VKKTVSIALSDFAVDQLVILPWQPRVRAGTCRHRALADALAVRGQRRCSRSALWPTVTARRAWWRRPCSRSR